MRLLVLLIIVCCFQLEAHCLNEKVGRWMKKLGFRRLFPAGSSDFIKQYQEIDEYLCQNLPNNTDTRANLDSATAWLADLERAQKRSNKKLIEALTQFLKLKKLDDDKLCIRISGDILESNDRSTGGSLAKSMESGSEPTKRVDRILYEYAMRHAKECPDVLKTKFSTYLAKIDETLMYRAESLIETLIARHMLVDGYKATNFDRNNPGEYIHKYPIETGAFVVDGMSQIGGEADEMIIYSKLNEFSSGDYDNVVLHDPNIEFEFQTRARRIFAKYLINTCTDYINWFDVVFEPLKFDLQFVEITSVFSRKDKNEWTLIEKLPIYEGCQNFLKNQKRIQKELLDYTSWVIKVKEFEN